MGKEAEDTRAVDSLRILCGGKVILSEGPLERSVETRSISLGSTTLLRLEEVFRSFDQQSTHCDHLLGVAADRPSEKGLTLFYVSVGN